ncbi:MAG: type II toxin-antitoxin system HicB family antitoxin [Chloroflexi bacterium]|nr:type II toxin-antitoxin system HicB family antitoxin [Chloroflexota bacterium]MCY3864424.1 type II toxin-antitoxin system HicB family antitoxin [Chloroflexota bacterium]MCY3914653.1 type II toxin-antitoxin system HicB family antitoxin [Chloroflexota bacterium]MDE2750491.1 type II toxin-antitoxin system HicB family antitoxin [Chloroflexota bacterium]MDE2855894.1 type II toxin-antitoxin system HicB family antitoxin [Chloroflexota bacterium]
METITVSFVKDGDGYVSHCLDYDIVSQGDSLQEAKDNIVEAVTGFLEIASPEEIQRRLESRGRVEQLRIGSA